LGGGQAGATKKDQHREQQRWSNLFSPRFPNHKAIPHAASVYTSPLLASVCFLNNFADGMIHGVSCNTGA
jgi:hypothetical protein